MAPGDRLICAFVEPQSESEQFADWPLHVTIVPWFRTPLTTATIVQALAKRLHNQPQFQVTLDGEAQFGRRGQKLVHLVQEPTPLMGIEQKIRSYLHKHDAWIADETTASRRPFRPHVTRQAHADVEAGSTFMCDTLYIVEQHGGYKAVVGEVALTA